MRIFLKKINDEERRCLLFHIALCDDSPEETQVILALLSRYLAERPGRKIKAHTFNTGNKLLEEIKMGRIYDLFLLDILMPGLTGIELARIIREKDENVPLIFLTATPEYALEAFTVQASQYILKPIKSENLFPVLDKIIFVQNRLQDDFLLVSTPESKVKVPFSSIIYVESMYHRMFFYLTDESKLSSKSIRTPFAKAIAPLIEDERFLYAHKSYILNMEQVKELTYNSFVMKNDAIVPIPRYKFANAKNIYLNFIAKTGNNY